MKNALDEIECIPVIGGLKPPYRITSHPYCVDIITTYVELSKLQFDNKKEFLKRIEEAILFYCNSNKIDFAFHFDNKYALTIPPSVNNFQWFLGLQIIRFDINKIKAFLSFQQKRFLSEEIDFITFVEFAVYNIVKNSMMINNALHLQKIMEWVDEQRISKSSSEAQVPISKEGKPKKNESVISKKASKQQKIMEWVDEQRTTKSTSEAKELQRKEDQQKENKSSIANKKAKQKKIKIAPPSFYLLALKSNPNYTVTNAKNLVDAFQLLKGGGFISNDTVYDRFRDILQNKVIKPENRIEWSGKVIELKMFVDLLMKQKIAVIKHNKWETVCNCFIKNGIDLLPDNIRQSQGKANNEQKLIDIVALI